VLKLSSNVTECKPLKKGVGKSSLINALINANAQVGNLVATTTGVQCYENTLEDRNDEYAVAMWDAPGFFDVDGEASPKALKVRLAFPSPYQNQECFASLDLATSPSGSGALAAS